jgi:hypothetical protein
MPETYGPILLKWKAKQLRHLTGDSRYRAALEFKKVSFIRRLGHALYRPFLLLVTEPIIMVFSVYLSAIFIIVYGFVCVLVSSVQYLADAFEYHAASALAAVQMLRLTSVGGMIVVAEPMYKKLGIAWTLPVLGAIATVFLPVP